MKTIPLTRGRITIVDDSDYERLLSFGKWHWQPSSTGRSAGYACTCLPLLSWRKYGSKRQFRIFMHDLLVLPRDGYEADHRDGNGLNNQRENLREATRGQQCFNRGHQKNKSGYKGVSFKIYPAGQRWYAHISVNGKQRHIGSFKTKENAALAYNLVAQELFGDFARFNEAPRC